MTTVAIVCKPNREELKQLLPELITWLRKHDYAVVLDREGAASVSELASGERVRPQSMAQTVADLEAEGLVREFRHEAQLLIVSHQKRTMETGDALYGVTMAPGGSSQVVSQKVDRQVDRQPESEPA